MYSYVARQPILDRELNTQAYELLFRDSLDNVFPSVSAQQATSRLVAEQFLQQNIDQLIGDHPCYINFPHSLLLDGLAECLPRDKVVIEILEDAEPDDALLEKVIQLYGLGYRLALDDFTMVSDWDRFLPYIHIIKFDLRSWGWAARRDPAQSTSWRIIATCPSPIWPRKSRIRPSSSG